MIDRLAEVLAALQADRPVDADDLAAARVIDMWRWSLTAGLYVAGTVDGRPWTTGEVVEVARSARWVRDADDVVWRLGRPADDEPPAGAPSCGCVMCDLRLPIDEWIDGVPHHRARGGELIACRNTVLRSNTDEDAT